jgi:hypothetical protein
VRVQSVPTGWRCDVEGGRFPAAACEGPTLAVGASATFVFGFSLPSAPVCGAAAGAGLYQLGIALGVPFPSHPESALDAVQFVSACALTTSTTTTIASAASQRSSSDDRERVKPDRLTAEQRQQHDRTNRLGLDDYRTEGNVVAVRPEAEPPEIVLANRDGPVVVQLLGDARDAASTAQTGDYLEADGVKETEQLFQAESVTITRAGRRIR